MRQLLVALALLSACPSPAPLDEPGRYRCETAADCPDDWFCRAERQGSELRCWDTPACGDVEICEPEQDGACYARADLSTACSLAGVWWVVWYTTVGCRDGCEAGAVIGGLGELDLDEAGLGIYRTLGGAPWSGVRVERSLTDARVTWAGVNTDPTWSGRLAASGDVMVGTHGTDGGLVWMLKTDPSAPPLPTSLEGRWRLIRLSGGFEHLFRLHGGELRYDANGCLVDVGEGIWPDPLHPFGPMQAALGECAVTDGAYLSVPIQAIDGIDEVPRLSGTLSSDGALGVFAQEHLGQWTGEVALLVRLPEESTPPPPLRGTHAFLRTAQSERENAAPRPEGSLRVFPLTGVARFEGDGRGVAVGQGDLGGGQAVHDFVNSRATPRRQGTWSLLIEGASGGFAMEAWPIMGRPGWPAPGLMLGHAIVEGSGIERPPGDPRPGDAPGDANLTVWVWDDEATLEGPPR